MMSYDTYTYDTYYIYMSYQYHTSHIIYTQQPAVSIRKKGSRQW